MSKTKLNRLRYEALRACRFRGHTIYRMKDSPDKKSAIGFCKECGRQVTVTCNPPPNGIEIMGEAVAVDCTPSIDSKLLDGLMSYLWEDSPYANLIENCWIETPTRSGDTIGKIKFYIGECTYTLKLTCKEE